MPTPEDIFARTVLVEIEDAGSLHTAAVFVKGTPSSPAFWGAADSPRAAGEAALKLYWENSPPDAPAPTVLVWDGRVGPFAAFGEDDRMPKPEAFDQDRDDRGPHGWSPETDGRGS